MNNILSAIRNEEKEGGNLKDIKYFKEVITAHNISNKVKEEIENILYVRGDIFIGEVRLIKTERMMSNEGVFLSGYKARIELIINEFFKYSLRENSSSIGIIRNNIIKIVDVILPETYLDINIEELYRKKRIGVKAYLEDMYCDRCKESIDVNLIILVNCTIN